jgi:hypothetical protein
LMAGLRIESEGILMRAQSLLFHPLVVFPLRMTGCPGRRGLGHSMSRVTPQIHRLPMDSGRRGFDYYPHSFIVAKTP